MLSTIHDRFSKTPKFVRIVYAKKLNLQKEQIY